MLIFQGVVHTYMKGQQFMVDLVFTGQIIATSNTT